MLVKKIIEYRENNIVLEGCYFFDDSISKKRPAVLVAHDWSGRNNFAENKAEQLAKLGYLGFALDMFGKGKLGNTNEEKMELMKPLMDDRALLLKRMLAAFDTIKKINEVDVDRIAAIGFCFGGLCALDLARSGAELKGVVSFHGLLSPPPQKDKTISAKVLALHGNDDPMSASDAVLAFQREMTEAKADWQMHIYGNAVHAFTNPLANDPGFGLVYNTLADKRSWIAMKNFFEEIF